MNIEAISKIVKASGISAGDIDFVGYGKIEATL